MTPTRKWLAQQTVAVGGWLVALISAGWDLTPSLQITGVGLVVAAVTSWATPNVKTPGGVPAKRRRRRSSGAGAGRTRL